MVRTQIYLTEKERAGLKELSRETGKKQSELIRDAIDSFLEKSKLARREAVLERTAGMWKDRNDLPNFEELRDEWDRMPLP